MAEASGSTPSEETGEDFVKRFTSLVTHGFISMSIALGMETGLFDALVKLHGEERSSQEIADAAGLKERYVREWLGVMVVARIVDINPETEKYQLPAHRLPFFTRGSSKSGQVEFTTALPMIGDIYEKLKECMKKDGPLGLPYSVYTTFHSLIANLTGAWLNNCLIQDFIPSLPVIEQQLESGIKVLDLGCGRGAAALAFAKAYPNSTVIGCDISQECIKFASDAASERGLANVTFVCSDATTLPEDWTNTFGYIFVHNMIHDLPRPDLVLKEVHRVLMTGCHFSMIDTFVRAKQADNLNEEGIARLYSLSLFHCLPISLYFEGSLGLGAAWGIERAKDFLTSAGFQVVSISKAPNTSSGHYLCTK